MKKEIEHIVIGGIHFNSIDVGDIYFRPEGSCVRYHIGSPTSNARGTLNGGGGKLLLYLTTKFGNVVGEDEIKRISGWKNVPSSIQALENQMKGSKYFEIVKVGAGYKLEQRGHSAISYGANNLDTKVESTTRNIKHDWERLGDIYIRDRKAYIRGYNLKNHPLVTDSDDLVLLDYLLNYVDRTIDEKEIMRSTGLKNVQSIARTLMRNLKRSNDFILVKSEDQKKNLSFGLETIVDYRELDIVGSYGDIHFLAGRCYIGEKRYEMGLRCSKGSTFTSYKSIVMFSLLNNLDMEVSSKKLGKLCDKKGDKLDTYLNNLRREVNQQSKDFNLVRTGAGYMLVIKDEVKITQPSEESKTLESAVDCALNNLFAGDEYEKLKDKIETAKLSIGTWSSVPRLNVGMVKLLTPGIKDIGKDEYIVNGGALLVEYLLALNIMPREEAEDLITKKLTNYFVHGSGFQLSRDKALSILDKINTERALEAAI